MDINYTDMLSRKLDNYIERHYANNKSALLLKGARQVGKTSAIRKYASKQKINLIEINFYEDDSALNIFKGSQNAKDVLLRISAHTKKKTSLQNTMIFFDEVQKCPEVITWIKFLVDEGSCKYALSGSLLGVELKGVESVPVGYMSVKEMGSHQHVNALRPGLCELNKRLMSFMQRHELADNQCFSVHSFHSVKI